MRNAIPILAIILANGVVSCSAGRTFDASTLRGRWVGKVVDGGKTVPIALDFTTSSTGLSGTMSLPTERLFGKPLTEVKVVGPQVSFGLPGHDAPLRFVGTVGADMLSGRATGGSHSIAMRFSRAAPVQVPYREKPLQFASGSVQLSGSLLIPNGSGPFPTVILIHGSSTPDRNDYRYFADLFARHGIAAFIYDKRATGGETNGGTASLETLADDVLAAAKMLDHRQEIDGSKLGLWGFSQGGWVAPIAASRRQFAFIAACSVPGVTYANVTLHADAAQLRSHGFSDQQIKDAQTAEGLVDNFVRLGGDPAPLVAVLDAVARKPWAIYTTIPRQIPTSSDRQTYLRWRNLDLDPALYWRKVQAPVFLAEGSADVNVPPIESLKRIRAALAIGGNRKVEAHLYPGANHNLDPAPSFEGDLVSWMLATVRS